MANKFGYTIEDYLMHREEYIGICLSCGAERDQTEPDAEDYKCESCGQHTVVGADNLMIDEFYNESAEEHL
jgi:predicted RNA-binding Zn-ribbon protein involved in translation (DUF1610 family)